MTRNEHSWIDSCWKKSLELLLLHSSKQFKYHNFSMFLIQCSYKWINFLFHYITGIHSNLPIRYDQNRERYAACWNSIKHLRERKTIVALQECHIEDFFLELTFFRWNVTCHVLMLNFPVTSHLYIRIWLIWFECFNVF